MEGQNGTMGHTYPCRSRIDWDPSLETYSF